MPIHDDNTLHVTAADWPTNAGADLFIMGLAAPAAPRSPVQGGGFADGPGWADLNQAAFSMASDLGLLGDRGTWQMASEWSLDLAATGLSSLKRVDIDIPDAARPVLAMFDKLGPGVAWQDAIGAVAVTPLGSTADGPVAARNTVDAALAPASSALVAPQVLASGTWLSNPQVTLKTSLGNIVVDLYPNAAPVTVANHLAYVGSGFFDDLLFHRVMPGFVVQGGGFATGLAYQAPPYAPILLESNNGLSNDRGTLAMARLDTANSATSQFFINLVNNVGLNYTSAPTPGYAVFGKVITGLSVVDAIAAVPARNIGNFEKVPFNDVTILEADQTRQGTLHSTSGRVDLGILAADAVPVWTGVPPTAWQYSLNAGASWSQSPGRGFTVPQGAYEAGNILVRYIGSQGTVGIANGPGGNMIVDTRAIKAGDGGANLLTGTSAADTMYALGGNDTLDGGSGNDSMIGGTGNDTYIVQAPADKTVEAAGGGTDRVNASVTFTLPSNVEHLTLTGSTAIHGTGNTLANTITGNTGANVLAGGSGNDTLNGGAGNDSLDGGTGSDSLVGGTGNDSYTVDSSTDVINETTTTVIEIDSVLSSVNWTLGGSLEKLTLTGSTAINGSGNTLANTITGNTGANVLVGGSGNDTLSGGSGNDSLDGGTGNDSLIGGTGNDSYTVGSGTDRISETSTLVTEIDRVTSSASFTLGSNLEFLSLSGAAAINGTGNSLANTITGNTGNNVLDGGSGNDTLSGGIGLDIFRFSSALNGTGNVDTIIAFAAVDDGLQLENAVFLKLTSTGALNSAFFRASSTGTAADSDDHIVYDTVTGKLFYDADGNGAGAPVLFATLTGAPALTSADIFVT